MPKARSLETLTVKRAAAEAGHAPPHTAKRTTPKAAIAAAGLLERVRLVAVERTGDDAEEGAELDERPCPGRACRHAAEAGLLAPRELVALRIGAGKNRGVCCDGDDAGHTSGRNVSRSLMS